MGNADVSVFLGILSLIDGEEPCPSIERLEALLAGYQSPRQGMRVHLSPLDVGARFGVPVLDVGYSGRSLEAYRCLQILRKSGAASTLDFGLLCSLSGG